eukprot:3411114-Lingulodinium_polyedra.AAC.1
MVRAHPQPASPPESLEPAAPTESMNTNKRLRADGPGALGETEAPDAVLGHQIHETPMHNRP